MGKNWATKIIEPLKARVYRAIFHLGVKYGLADPKNKSVLKRKLGAFLGISESEELTEMRQKLYNSHEQAHLGFPDWRYE